MYSILLKSIKLDNEGLNWKFYNFYIINNIIPLDKMQILILLLYIIKFHLAS